MNNNIWSPKGMPPNQACCKIPYKGYEISIAMDDSCGGMSVLQRTDIRIWRDYDGADVTKEFYKGIGDCVGHAENLKKIFVMIDMYGDRE